jgi:hypothetical protein
MHRTKGGGPQLGANTPGTYGPYGGHDEPAATDPSRRVGNPGPTEPNPAETYGENS